MKYKHKSLSKNTFAYLIITFIVFIVTAEVMMVYIDKYMDDELEERFRFSEQKAERHFRKSKTKSDRFRNVEFKKLDTAPDINLYPSYRDTTLLRHDASEHEPHRIKTRLINDNENYYEMSIYVRTGEYFFLRKVILNTLLPAYIILTILVVLINKFLSGILFRPFYKILEQMKTFSLGKKLDNIDTNTREFNDMQNLFQNMIKRIEDDYKNLKEYTENMSHEMQTPLSVMRSKIEHLLTDSEVMEKQSEIVKQIYSEVNHLSNLGSALNLLTKIENKEFHNPQNLYTKEIIEKHTAKISELAALKSLNISLDLSEDHSLYIDPILFDIILTNLIRNSLKYSDPGSEIKIQTSEKFEISNDGNPLNEHHSKLFERFYSVDKGNKSLGLGLSIVKKICEINNITIFYNYENARHCFILEQNVN